MYGVTHTIEDDNDDYTADEMKRMFSKLLVAAGYSTSVLDEPEES